MMTEQERELRERILKTLRSEVAYNYPEDIEIKSGYAPTGARERERIDRHKLLMELGSEPINSDTT